MKPTHRARTSHATLLLCAWLGACGGGGSADVAAPAASTGSPEPIAAPSPIATPGPAPVSERGKVILYVATSQSGTTYDPETGITIEHAGLSVIRYVPELGRVTRFASTTSFDFAENVLAPYTVDDRVFLREGHPPGTGSTQRWREVDPLATAAPAASGQLLQNGSYLRGCGAVVGAQYYFEGYPITDVFRRTNFGDFRVATLAPLSTAGSTQLLARGDRDHCRSNLASAGGKLYDAEFESGSGRVLLHRRDTASGRIVETTPLAPDDAAGWSYRFSFDDGVAYFARHRASDQRLQVYRHVLGAAGAAERVYDAVHAGFAPNGMDSDDGKVLLWDGPNGLLLVIDASTGTGDVRRTDFTITEAQILVLKP